MSRTNRSSCRVLDHLIVNEAEAADLALDAARQGLDGEVVEVHHVARVGRVGPLHTHLALPTEVDSVYNWGGDRIV